jgi:hypothetical protein
MAAHKMPSVTIRRARRYSMQVAVAALLLLVLLLRAWIPVGFMPTAHADGGAQLVVCPGVQHHGGGSDHSSPSDRHDVLCPFAASASSAPTPAIVAFGPCSLVTGIAGPYTAEEIFSPSILRSQSPRAPPFFG